jgi:hypothetical protein
MTALHGPIDTSTGYGCLVRMRYRLADAYVAALEERECTHRCSLDGVMLDESDTVRRSLNKASPETAGGLFLWKHSEKQVGLVLGTSAIALLRPDGSIATLDLPALRR